MKVQAEKSEDQSNAFRRFIRVLRRKGIYRVLVNERWIWMSQSVKGELVVEIVMFQLDPAF